MMYLLEYLPRLTVQQLLSFYMYVKITKHDI